MTKFDRTEQRIIGVLIEKQLSVPDSYPLSENALVDGCNQKNNREPVTELVAFQVAGALMALQQKGYVAKIDGAGRVAKFKHRLAEELHLDNKELAVMAELLLRGPQAAGALKPRVARMACHGTPEEIEALLRRLSERRPALAELLALAPRERERRWRHLVGDGSEFQAAPIPASAPPPSVVPAVSSSPPRASDLEGRVVSLERQMAEQRQQLDELRDTLWRLQSPKSGD